MRNLTRNFAILIALFTLTIFTSCSKEEDEDINPIVVTPTDPNPTDTTTTGNGNGNGNGTDTTNTGTGNGTGTDTTTTTTETAAQIATKALIAANTTTRIELIAGRSFWTSKYHITFNTTTNTVSVDFAENADINFTMEWDANNTTTYTINSAGQLVLGQGEYIKDKSSGVTYDVTAVLDSGLNGLKLTAATGSINSYFQSYTENK